MRPARVDASGGTVISSIFQPMTQIAFLGTGLLGSAFVEAGAKRGDTITVWNRTADKARARRRS